MRMHERQGSITDALCIAKSSMEGISNVECGMTTLLGISKAYYNCLNQGLWTNALEMATSCCTQSLIHPSLTSTPKLKVHCLFHCISIDIDVKLVDLDRSLLLQDFSSSKS